MHMQQIFGSVEGPAGRTPPAAAGSASGQGRIERLAAGMLREVPMLRGLALHWTGNQQSADELVCRALREARRRTSSFKAGMNVRAWLVSVLREAYGMQVPRRKQPEAFQADQTRSDGEAELDQLLAAVARLVPDQHDALILVGTDELPYLEAARRGHCDVEILRTRVHRARRELVDLLA